MNISSATFPKSAVDPHNSIAGQGEFLYRINIHWAKIDLLKTPILIL